MPLRGKVFLVENYATSAMLPPFYSNSILRGFMNLFLIPLFCLSSLAAFAQEPMDPAELNRMDRLERDIQLLQRQIARTPADANQPLTADPYAGAGNPAQLEVRFSAIENQIRELRGKIEETEFQNRKTAEAMEKLQRDVEFRLNEMANQRTGVATITTAINNEEPVVKTVTASNNATPPTSTTAGDGTLRPPEPTSANTTDTENFATPREHYTYAFRLLNQTKYEEAAKAFDSFTKKYPKDPLIGNAYYWQGETFYIRRDYVSAADSFRQGFETAPEGPKAPDNLLKLAMSLDALQRTKEACVVLEQISAKYKQAATKITEKATKEQKRMGCKS